MKRRTALVFFMLSLAAIFGSCSKDDDSSSAPKLSSSIQQGKWKITLFEDDGTNETSNFTGNEFEFKSGGTLAVTGNGANFNGTWSDGSDDSTTKLIINLGTNSPYDDLNEDWRVLEQTSTKIRLQHVSGGNGGTDYLTFEKI